RIHFRTVHHAQVVRSDPSFQPTRKKEGRRGYAATPRPIRLRTPAQDALRSRSATALPGRGARGVLGGPFRGPLNIIIERELPRMRTQPYRVDLVLPLVLDPRLDDVRREYVALEQPVVALLEVVEHDRQLARQLLDLLLLGRRQ